MFAAEQNASETSPSPRRLEQRIGLTILVLVLTVVFTKLHVHSPTNGRWDFETFYLVAQMVRHGDGARLYDYTAQAAYQMRYVDPLRTVSVPDLLFLYPAATVLLFLPLAWLPVAGAFALWTLANLALLVMSVRLLQPHLRLPQGDRPIFAALFFMPLFFCLIQGQVTVVLLFLYAAAFSSFKRGNPFSAGFLLGLGTFKFQLLLGFFGVLLVRRCWKALGGVACGGFLVALVSTAIVGWRAMLRYPVTLLSSAHDAHLDTPQKMVSLRGIITAAIGHPPSFWLIAILSVAIILFVGLLRSDDEVVFSAAVVASILVAYHAYAHESTLLLIPGMVAAARVQRLAVRLAFVAAAIVAAGAPVFYGRLQTATVLTFGVIAFGLWYAQSIHTSSADTPDHSLPCTPTVP